MIGKEMSVMWHISDFKISHVNAKQVTRVIAYLNNFYGGLLIFHGNIHEHIGMELDLS